MKGQFRKVVAIVCAFALFVTGLTIQTKKVSADDYSALTYTQVGKKDYWVAAGNDDFPFQMVQDQGDQFLIIPQVAAGTKPIWPDFTNATLNGATFSQPAGAGIYIKYADLKDNAYNVFEATSAVDNHTFQIIIKAGTPVEGETTTADPNAPTTTPAPTTTSKLQAPSAPDGLVANINDIKTNYTIAFANVATATSYKLYLDGTYVKDITNGGVVTIEELGLEAGKTYTFGVSAVNAAGESAISTVSVTVPSAEETTTTEAETEAFDPSTITDWTKVKDSTTMSYYIANGAETKVSVKPEMHGDNVYVAYGLAAKFKSVNLNGEAVTPREGADVEIPKTSFTEGYNKLDVTDFYGKETVTIYFNVEKEAETTTVTVDGKDVAVENGKVTLGDAEYGYYCNGKMYKAGSEVEVTEDMAFTSVKELNITMAQGAGIRYIGDTGLRFQATITSDNMDAVASDAITEGTLITTSDIYNDGKDGELTLEYAKTKLKIVNSGWYNNKVGVYCGSICKIAENNYKREFVARAYVTINYADGTSETTYSNNMAPSRSIQKVAQLLIGDNYGGISEEYHSVIDNFAK